MASTRNSRAAFTHLVAALLTATLFAVAISDSSAQTDELRIELSQPDRIRISERTNLSTRVNGQYAGLLSRQVTGYLALDEATWYEGRFFLYEQVRRDLTQVGRSVDRSIESRVSIEPGTLFANEGDYPSLQSLIRSGPGELRPGVVWDAPAWIVLNPQRDPESLRLPVVVQYRLVGRELWNGSPSLRIEAQFATRYPLPPSDDPDAPVVVYSGPIVSVAGTHRLTIMLPEAPTAAGEDASAAQVAFIRDELSEQYRFTDGSDRLVQGHTLLFLTGLTAEAQARIAGRVEEELRAIDVPDVSVDRTPTGVRLTVQALRFLPDQAILLPEERGRLDAVAATLRQLESVRFLVVGHTADVGSVESQVRLSVERARVIAAELAARGVSPDLIDIEGRGGSDPVASNAAEEGRARNRRVEIYIVEE